MKKREHGVIKNPIDFLIVSHISDPLLISISNELAHELEDNEEYDEYAVSVDAIIRDLKEKNIYAESLSDQDYLLHASTLAIRRETWGNSDFVQLRKESLVYGGDGDDPDSVAYIFNNYIISRIYSTFRVPPTGNQVLGKVSKYCGDNHFILNNHSLLYILSYISTLYV